MIHFAEPPKSRQATSSGGCLSGFLLIPLSVVAVSILLILVLSKVTIVTATSLEVVTPVPAAPSAPDPTVFLAPYEHYTLTQGPHGQSYGHLAIDLAAGKGAAIRSPINGEVSALFTDSYGNPTLIIENEIYQVTLLHGNYTVQIGEQVLAGQFIGTESNHGYTTDMQGNSCAGRDCGYHTHLNVYNKQLGENINPLTLINP